MRILKRPKFKKATCHVCGCVFVPSDKDINPFMCGITANCPTCRAACPVVPKKKPEPAPQQRGGDE